MPPPRKNISIRDGKSPYEKFFGTPSPITPDTRVSFGRIGYVTYGHALKNKYKPRACKCYMVGYAANHSPHTYEVFKYKPGKAGEIIVTRNVKWVNWDRPNKSKSTDLSPLFTKVEGLSKDQKALLERAIDKFIIDNRMCSKKYTKTHQNKSIQSD
jgi:hypothetical protein